jgi:hypothetical protein
VNPKYHNALHGNWAECAAAALKKPVSSTQTRSYRDVQNMKLVHLEPLMDMKHLETPGDYIVHTWLRGLNHAVPVKVLARGQCILYINSMQYRAHVPTLTTRYSRVANLKHLVLFRVHAVGSSFSPSIYGGHVANHFNLDAGAGSNLTSDDACVVCNSITGCHSCDRCRMRFCSLHRVRCGMSWLCSECVDICSVCGRLGAMDTRCWVCHMRFCSLHSYSVTQSLVAGTMMDICYTCLSNVPSPIRRTRVVPLHLHPVQ